MEKRLVIAATLLSVLFLAGMGKAKPGAKPDVKLFVSPASTVPSADLVKHFLYKCPNVTITLEPKESNYMLEAGGWPGHYRFALFRKGGDAVFATSTVFLSNAVKDVCKYVNSKAPAPSHPK